jgi:hypothetical protein
MKRLIQTDRDGQRPWWRATKSLPPLALVQLPFLHAVQIVQVQVLADVMQEQAFLLIVAMAEPILVNVYFGLRQPATHNRQSLDKRLTSTHTTVSYHCMLNQCKVLDAMSED